MSDTPLTGVRAVVTGAARGLGRAMSLALAGAGAEVVATDVDGDALTETVELGRAAPGTVRGMVLDITAEAAVESLATRLWREHGGVDVLFANAGIVLVRPSLETTPADLRRVLDVNVVGTFVTARSFGARMLRQGHGRIVLTASQAGQRGTPEWLAYCASKAALISMTQTLSSEWGPAVTVNAIAPGAFVTDLNRHLMAEPGYLERLRAGTALGRVGHPDDIGPLAVFLAGPGAALMTGGVVNIDGGVR
ncbi:SDR family NAD(P)-dependent oxidoreductase [Actinoplanes sp. RD1]|uniref:SDR family NAD(P)-dependent oxidoreductase n=1 Tax=Actinoplanes sp. RD1 TaxID=3064538 RepID=UPI002741B92E|nr:SDR family oxidoreductase [Actinoplanes sp. RD1]